MAVRNLHIGQVGFNSAGLVDYFSASVEKDGKDLPIAIYPQRDGKLISFCVESSAGKVTLPARLSDELLRILTEYDKLGRKSINLSAAIFL